MFYTFITIHYYLDFISSQCWFITKQIVRVRVHASALYVLNGFRVYLRKHGYFLVWLYVRRVILLFNIVIHTRRFRLSCNHGFTFYNRVYKFIFRCHLLIIVYNYWVQLFNLFVYFDRSISSRWIFSSVRCRVGLHRSFIKLGVR